MRFSRAMNEVTMKEYWEIIKEKTQDHWLEVKDPEGWYSAVVKWDGCIDFRRYFNEPLPYTGEHPQMENYIHICDIDEEIKRLQALRDKAREFFGEDWE